MCASLQAELKLIWLKRGAPGVCGYMPTTYSGFVEVTLPLDWISLALEPCFWCCEFQFETDFHQVAQANLGLL